MMENSRLLCHKTAFAASKKKILICYSKDNYCSILSTGTPLFVGLSRCSSNLTVWFFFDSRNVLIILERAKSEDMSGLVCVSQKIRKLFEPEKQFVKLRPARSIKLVFPFVVKSIKIKITAKFRDMEHLRFEDTKRIMSHEKFRDFRETGPWKQNRFFII